MKIKLLIFHFFPIEYYPPAFNFIRHAIFHRPDVSLTLVSPLPSRIKRCSFKLIKEIRTRPIEQSSFFKRMLAYAELYIRMFVSLLLNKHAHVLCYESPTTLPLTLFTALGLKKKKSKIFIHYHEYFNPKEYKDQMRLVQWAHRWEKYLYSKSYWISHTNDDRLAKFSQDLLAADAHNLQILPNYPPRSWRKYFNIKEYRTPIRLVYIGSLSLQRTYFKEIVFFVESRAGAFTLDIFSINLYPEIIELLDHLSSPYIRLHNAVNYDSIPQLLSNYDIGLVLYKDNTDNYKYNASNKLFEYAICGLDVWFSSDMLSANKYSLLNSRPRIFPVDFTRLEEFNWKAFISRQDLPIEEIPWEAEGPYKKLLDAIVSNEDRNP